MEITAVLLPGLVVAIIVAMLYLQHKRAVRSHRLIEKYLRLHAKCPGPIDEVDKWLLTKVDALWFGGKEFARLRPGMKIINIHQLWYKGVSWDAMECEALLMDTERNFGIQLEEGSITRDFTLGDLAELIRRNFTSHPITH